MKTSKSILIVAAVCAFNLSKSQDYGPGNGNATSSDPCVPGSIPWYIGGNVINAPNVMTPNSPPIYNDAGTCNNISFVLKANNKQSVFILPNSNVGIGLNNSTPGAALDVRSSIATSQSNFRIHADYYGNLESTTHINLGYGTGSDFNINEGPIYTGVGSYSGANRMKIFGTTGYALFGTPNMYTPSTRFHITNDVDANQPSATGALYGAAVEQNITNSSSMTGNWVIGVSGRVVAPGNLYANGIGIEGVSSIYDNGNVNLNWNIGVDGIGKGGNSAYGVRGRGAASNDSENPFNRSLSVGVSGEANPTANGDGFGVEGYGIRLPGLTGNVYGGLFWGDAHVTGDLDVAGNGLFNTSDKKFKDQIEPLTNSLDKILALKPSTYVYKKDEFPGMNFPEGKQMGLIAQELEAVFPGSVKDIKSISYKDKDGKVLISNPDYKAVNYISLIPLLISGIQEQQKQLVDQNKQNSDLKNLVDMQQQQINELLTKSTNATGVNQLNPDMGGFTMDQNIPNPFSRETTINFTLPQQINDAFMAVYDLSGKQITSFPLTQRGKASINITSEKLAAGIYIYSIVADGKVMDSKRMVVAEK